MTKHQKSSYVAFSLFISLTWKDVAGLNCVTKHKKSSKVEFSLLICLTLKDGTGLFGIDIKALLIYHTDVPCGRLGVVGGRLIANV